jgi:hypothetical protein
MAKKVLYWTPRIIGILAILFMMMFSMDCFGEYDSFSKQLTCFFMHNTPAFICVIVLFIAWKWELIGGVIFILAFIAGTVFFNSFSGNWGSLIVISPFLITGILFITDYRVNKKKAVI